MTRVLGAGARVIPFNAKIEGKADIKNYADYLVEKAGGAVLSWIIEGAQKVIECNFKLSIPQCVNDAINHYRENNDWLSMFIEDCCEVDPSYTQKSGELYQEYRAYCARTGEYTRTPTVTNRKAQNIDEIRFPCVRY